MKYVEAPQDCKCAGPEPAVFLGGGITGCPDWQADVVARLADANLTLLNPRRAAWDMTVSSEQEQIEWEYIHLRRANAILFWFPAETLCPIALFELGAWLFRPKKLFIGCHPGYQRNNDVRIQTRLERYEQKVWDSLDGLISEVLSWSKAKKNNG